MASSQGRNGRDSSRVGFEKRQKRRQIRSLQEAIDKHDTESVKTQLQEDFDVDFQYRSQTALQLAVKENCLDICRILIEKGANVNMTDAEMNNLLNMACWRGYQDVSELLVQNGANIDDQNMNGYSAIHTCASQGQADILQYLISQNSDLDSLSRQMQTPLHLSVKNRHSDIVQLLLIGGCNVDKIDENRRTALMYAAEFGFDDITQILVNGGANLNCQDRLGRTALFEAVHNGHLNIVQTLSTSGADINLPVTKGSSPLLESISCDHTDIAVYLIDAKCNVNQTDRLKQAPIHSAVGKVSQFFSEESEQAVYLVKKLVEAGCDLDVANQEGERPLYMCACGGNIELTEYFLSKGVDLTVKTKTGDTILHGGVHSNKPAVVDLLIKAGCSLNEKNLAGEHALLTAVIYRSDIQIIKSLVEAGSNLDMKDKTYGNTPLHNALIHYYRQAGEYLIDAGCDVNILNLKRFSPLYVACEKNEDMIARKIMTHPKFISKILRIASIPQPLFAAVSNNHIHLVQMLIDAGCDIDMVNKDGMTSLQLSIQENCPSVTKLLLMYNCDMEAHAKVKRLYKCCLTHEDRHPHFDLEPLFLALTHRSTEMMQLLIDCYWQRPVKTISMLDQILKTAAAELNTHYSPELKMNYQRLFYASTKMPLSLQHMCRASIREKLGSCPQSKVDKLPIAKKLTGYILMEEYFGNLFEEVKQHEIDHPSDFQDFHSVGYIPAYFRDYSSEPEDED
ncbi:hypothetical protein ACF0H5_001357 [Mactra antiquata]